MISPQLSNGGYNAVESPGNSIAAYQGHLSLSATPWQQHSGYNPVQYAQVLNELSTGHEPMSSRYVHELPMIKASFLLYKLWH
jgi:hypothetical protein